MKFAPIPLIKTCSGQGLCALVGQVIIVVADLAANDDQEEASGGAALPRKGGVAPVI
ncbi:MAG: hypothetical protein ACYC9T_16720 [Trichloromonadaceae bacterium]